VKRDEEPSAGRNAVSQRGGDGRRAV